MRHRSLLPYFHPTTVAFVDDDATFLSNLTLQLDAELAYRLFDSPAIALRRLNNDTHFASLADRVFVTADDDVTGVPKGASSLLDFEAIQREVHNTQRFTETAVVFVDYSMPEMNGLDFCQQINNPYVKKVLFTGVANESVAVQAFNEGIIDRFIRKSEREVYDQVNVAIRHLQKAYVKETSKTISHILSLQRPYYLADTAFIHFFDQLTARHSFIEHYVATAPPGVLFLKADGSAARLVVLTDEDLNRHAQIARTHGAPQELLQALTSGDVVPYFDSTPDGFFRPYCTNWRQYLYPSQTLAGQERYHWALVSDCNIAAEGEIASYNEYLAWLDTAAYALP